MRICAFDRGHGPEHGLIEGTLVYTVQGSIFGSTVTRGEAVGSFDSLILLPPIFAPSKIICAGKNYAAHAAEFGGDVPAEPLIFLKPPSSLIGPGVPVELLPEMGRVDHEAELVAVIGRHGRDIPREHALGYVFGYCAANDISERDYQKADGQWTRAKGFDTFCPLGPWVDTELDPRDLGVRMLVNGEVRQSSRTSLLVYDLATLITHISHIMTLEPGDLILTGTPEGVSPIHAGDDMVVSVEGLGDLRNPVRMRS